jgi:crotonobetainyl-CoA:carnitine CoA-transferase CaiB-like acyl-CoA transferase
MTRPFEGIRIIDATHVLAGPFAAYQLGLLGADVIKIEHPEDPDQSRVEWRRLGSQSRWHGQLLSDARIKQAQHDA